MGRPTDQGVNLKIVKVLCPRMGERIEQGLCPFCGKKPEMSEFRDKLSLREYGISGLCQKCQDDTFRKED